MFIEQLLVKLVGVLTLKLGAPSSVSCYLSSLDLQLVINTGGEVMEHDHLALRAQAVLLLNPHPNLGCSAVQCSAVQFI